MNPFRGPVLAGLLLIACLTVPLRGQVSEVFLDQHQPRMESLFATLDPDQPHIGDIVASWDSGERVDAANALCDFYRNKRFQLNRLDEPLIPGNVIEQAEAALENRFFLLNEWEQAKLTSSGSIDWEGRGSRNDKERAWMLNRHAFLLHLAEAARRTGDNRFATALNELWEDWILQNPYPNRLSFSASWRALEVARRILNVWVYLFYRYDVLNDETRLLVLSSVLDHGDSLSEHTSFWGGNHLITEKLALLALASAWPEFKQSEAWRSNAIAEISSQFISQTYPDGSYKELSNHYQRVVLTNTVKFLNLLGATGHPDDYGEVIQRIELMWDFFAGVMRPDGFGPLNNASDQEHNAAFIREVWQKFNRPDWLYMASNGLEGDPPPPDGPSRLFPWAGQAILRTGWERDAGWVYFDAGPYGTAHQHVDRLHVSAALKGRPLLVDNGRYVYQPGPWKEYFQGPASHNILLLDGQPSKQAPREVESPLPVMFEERESVAFASASAQFQPTSGLPLLPSLTGSVPWTRSVLLDRLGRFAVIVDHIVSFKNQTWTARWHFHPDLTAEEAGNALTLISPADPPDSIVRFGSGPPEVAGFHSPEYNVKQPAVQWDVSGKTNGSTTLVWLLQSPDYPPMKANILSRPEDPTLHMEIIQRDARIAAFRLQLHPKPVLIDFEVF